MPYYSQRTGHMSHLQDLINDYLVGKKDLVGIEIGSYGGESTEMFLNSGAFKSFYCIDPWLNSFDPNDPTGDDGLNIAEQRFDELFKNNPIVKKIKMLSNDARSTFDSWFKDQGIDFIYIDGDHRYESVLHDLINYAPLVKIGGIVAGHDYVDETTISDAGIPDHIIGVAYAVRQYFACLPDKRYLDFSWAYTKNKPYPLWPYWV